MKHWMVRDLTYLAVFVAVLVALSYGLEAIPIAGMAYYNRIIVMMGINITLAVSLNIINGHAGQFSLGHAGFMAIGAYFAAFLTVYHFAPIVENLPVGMQQWLMQNALLLLAVLLGGGMAAVSGYVVGLPSLRLRGDYLAIVTLGFGEIIRVMILNIEKIGAARGFSGIPRWANFFWVYFFAGLTILVSWRLVRSSVGRAFLAVREDQIAAEAMGVDATRYKVKAFIIGSFLAGVAGGLFAHYMMYLNPTMFMFVRSFEVVAMVVLGGLGSISGSVVAAVILTFLPEGLRAVKDYIPGGKDPRMIIYSLMLIILMLTRPQGLLGRR
ncbi:MAG TPA: branched-chain amino acid ABC transporter permease, partial [Thermoanaerobaculia bacterium]|nr:branched-chain amino acid ABC transporter permease [Thermoanaerobaculia bacterium]